MEKIAKAIALIEGYTLQQGRAFERIAKAADLYCANQRAANRAEVIPIILPRASCVL